MSHVRRLALTIIVGLTCTLAASSASAATVDLPRFPSISPDGKSLVFSWRGDLWKVGTRGGMARRLTHHPGEDLRSCWSPDGKQIAFNSFRAGGNNIFLMSRDGRSIRQLTHSDQPLIVSDYSKNSKGQPTIAFYAWTNADPYYHSRPFAIPAGGGSIQRIHNAFGSRPVTSPDGQFTVFTRGTASWYRKHYRGSTQLDLWLYSHAKKSFKQLTQWAGNDGKAQWVDNDSILFLSDRQFNTMNLYRMDVKKGRGSVTRLTEFKGRDIQDVSVSANGRMAAFTVWNRIHVLNLKTPKAKHRALNITAPDDEADRFTLKSVSKQVTEAALSPDGKTMAMVAYGEVFIRGLADSSPTRRVTQSHAREKDIAWSPDGARLYFTSDRDGTESIYEATVELTRGEIKKQWEQPVEKPKGKAADQPNSEPAEKEQESNANASEPADSDKNEKAKSKEAETDQKKPEPKIEIPPHLKPERWHDAIRFAVKPVVQLKSHDRDASPSPDGIHLAFRRGRGNLVILNRMTEKSRTLVKGWDTSLHWSWRPDGRFIAYCHADRDFNYDIRIATADGSKPPVNITKHPDNEFNPSWSADGKWLNFISERVNEENDVWSVALDRSLDSLPQPERDAYFKKAAAEAKKRKPIGVIVFPSDSAKRAKKKSNTAKAIPKKGVAESLDIEDAYLRLRRVTRLDGNERNNLLLPAGDQFVYTGSGGYDGLWTAKWNGSGAKKLAGSMRVQHASLTGDKIVTIDKGRVAVVTLAGAVQYIDPTATIRIDLEQQNSQKFLEAARTMGERFYQPTMKGLNWQKLTQRYHPLAKAARTPTEFDLVGNRLLGELNASHLSIRAPKSSSPLAQPVGYLGADIEPAGKQYRVTALLDGGPAATSPSPIEVGDVITAVELQPVQDFSSLDQALSGRAGKETIVSVLRKVKDKPTKLDLLVTPTSFSTIRSLKYDAWRKQNAKKVNEWSKGKLGYIHIRSMNQSSLDEYERDLYAAAHGKKGLLVDVRNNGGGWTTDRLLASIMNQPHAYTVPRGADPMHKDGYPQDRLFIQRYSMPINMLCNERSISNAEIISHAFKTLKRGTLVGQTTYGGVISTGRMQLIDGTSLSLPFRGWYLPDDTDMENNGAVPDLIVPQTPQAEVAGKDEQLKAAVDDLLKRVK